VVFISSRAERQSILVPAFVAIQRRGSSIARATILALVAVAGEPECPSPDRGPQKGFNAAASHDTSSTAWLCIASDAGFLFSARFPWLPRL
jgi:hypothetical protein